MNEQGGGHSFVYWRPGPDLSSPGTLLRQPLRRGLGPEVVSVCHNESLLGHTTK